MAKKIVRSKIKNEFENGEHKAVIKRAAFKIARSSGAEMLSIEVESKKNREWINMPLEATEYKIGQLMDQIDIAEIDDDCKQLLGKELQFWKFESGDQIYTSFVEPQ